MNIVVLVKQVPDTTEIKIDKETHTLIRTGVKNIINPDDLAGVEEALKLKETYGGRVITVTMGPEHAKLMIKSLYARGVDEAYLLSDRKFAGSDTWATSYILSSFLKTLDYDLIIAGYQAIDGDTAQVGPQVAEFLNIPQITHINEVLDINQSKITVRKAFEDEIHTLVSDLPCLITTVRTMNTPRLMSAFKIWETQEKSINLITYDSIALNPEYIGLKGSPTRVKATFTKPVTKKSEKEVLEPSVAAKRILKLIYPYMEVSK
jgi:electron transfer flavoprotein beta subunit